MTISKFIRSSCCVICIFLIIESMFILVQDDSSYNNDFEVPSRFQLDEKKHVSRYIPCKNYSTTKKVFKLRKVRVTKCSIMPYRMKHYTEARSQLI